MKISDIKATALLVPYREPYHWAQGTIEGADVVLVEVHTDEGIVGYGESIGSPFAEAITECLRCVKPICVGADPFANARLMTEAYHALFQAFGNCSSPRFSGRLLSGVEMALWDVMGKATAKPVHALLGGAVRDEICYFGFAQGDSADELAHDAANLSGEGFEVIYFKVGRGDALDLRTAEAIRAAVGPKVRLRVDPNEQWTPDHALRMIRQLAVLGIEMVEQPTHCESIAALAQVRTRSPISISADQAVFTPFEAYEVCRQQAADMIVVGVHETGGLLRFLKVAHIAEAAGLNVCIHGLYETGITTCASNQAAAAVPNLDDANQHMTRFLAWDIIKSPNLKPTRGRLPVLNGPGLGFEIDWDGVERATCAYSERKARGRKGQGVTRRQRTKGL